MTCIQTTAQETSFQRTQKSPTRLNNQQRVYICNFSLHLRQRPYHVENTGSRPITEVKQRRARLVLGWVTAWEHRVQLASIFFFQLSKLSNLNLLPKRNMTLNLIPWLSFDISFESI